MAQNDGQNGANEFVDLWHSHWRVQTVVFERITCRDAEKLVAEFVGLLKQGLFSGVMFQVLLVINWQEKAVGLLLARQEAVLQALLDLIPVIMEFKVRKDMRLFTYLIMFG